MNPYPYYQKIRHMEPVFKAVTGEYVITDYENCKKILSHPHVLSGTRLEWVGKFATYSGAKKELDYSHLHKMVAGMLLNQNGDMHIRHRKAIMARWPEKKELNSIVEDCIRSIGAGKGKIDFVQWISQRLPVMVISRIMRLPEDKSIHYIQDSLNMVQILDPYLKYTELQSINESSKQVYEFIHQHIDQIELVQYDDIDPDQRTEMAVFLFIAGFETTSALLSQCIYYLLSHKEFISQLDSLEKIMAYVDEMLRLYTPVHILGRKAVENIDLGEIMIPADSTITLCIGSANRDEKKFKNADQVDLARNPHQHISFGFGLHHCLGEHLAKFEAIKMLEILLPEVASMELFQKPELRGKLAIRNVSKMEVVLP